MSSFWIGLVVQGRGFSPTAAASATGLAMVDTDEPGELAGAGRHAGQQRTGGRAVIRSPDATAVGLAELVEAHLGTLRRLGATEMHVEYVDLASAQGNGELSSKDIAALARLDLPLTIHLYPRD